MEMEATCWIFFEVRKRKNGNWYKPNFEASARRRCFGLRTTCHAHLQLGDGGGLSATHGKWYRNTPTKYGCNYHQIGRQVHIHTKHVGIGLTHDLFATCFGNIHLPTWIPLDIGILLHMTRPPPTFTEGFHTLSLQSRWLGGNKQTQQHQGFFDPLVYLIDSKTIWNLRNHAFQKENSSSKSVFWCSFGTFLLLFGTFWRTSIFGIHGLQTIGLEEKNLSGWAQPKTKLKLVPLNL